MRRRDQLDSWLVWKEIESNLPSATISRTANIDRADQLPQTSHKNGQPSGDDDDEDEDDDIREVSHLLCYGISRERKQHLDECVSSRGITRGCPLPLSNTAQPGGVPVPNRDTIIFDRKLDQISTRIQQTHTYRSTWR